MNNMNEEKDLIKKLKEHLDKFSPEDLAKQLFDCKADGPTLDEFLGQLRREIKENVK